eukprot:6527488-Alexandrium_andersonii.AAC.1
MDDSQADPFGCLPSEDGSSCEAEGNVGLAAVREAGGPDDEFIAVPWTETSNTSQEPQGYWQRRGKSSAKAQIRKFLFTGACRWQGQPVRTAAQLASVFDPQLVAHISRQ